MVQLQKYRQQRVQLLLKQEPGLSRVFAEVRLTQQRISNLTPPLPFQVSILQRVKPNIFVVSTEDYFAMLMEWYSSRISDLTPTMDAYFGRFVLVENSYDHKVASCRGIIGRLSSG